MMKLWRWQHHSSWLSIFPKLAKWTCLSSKSSKLTARSSKRAFIPRISFQAEISMECSGVSKQSWQVMASFFSSGLTMHIICTKRGSDISMEGAPVSRLTTIFWRQEVMRLPDCVWRKTTKKWPYPWSNGHLTIFTTCSILSKSTRPKPVSDKAISKKPLSSSVVFSKI